MINFEVAKSLIELFTALILLWLAVAPIAIKKFNKTKPKDRQRSASFVFTVFTSLLACVSMFLLQADLIGLGLFFGFFCCVCIACSFCFSSAPITRLEVAVLIISWCGLVFLITAIPIERIVDALEIQIPLQKEVVEVLKTVTKTK
jgi:hypothetical protein